MESSPSNLPSASASQIMCIYHHESGTSQSSAEVPGGPSRYANKGEIGRKSGRELPPGVVVAMVDEGARGGCSAV